MIGPVQLMILGFSQDAPELPPEIRTEIEALKTNPAVRLLDVLQITVDRDGRQTEHQLEGLMPEGGPPNQGKYIRNLMTVGAAAKVMHGMKTSGSGYLYRKGPIPDQSALPEGANVLLMLLEHYWACSFWSAMHRSPAYPVGDVWMGHEGLEEAGLPLDT